MRHPGLCGLRAVICALIVLALCVVLTLIPRKGTDPEPVMNGTASVSHTLGPRRLRETANGYMASLSDSWMNHPSPPHPYATNMWWRLANHTVKEYGSKNCYVCTQFPHSTTGVDWWPHQDHNTSTFMAMVAVAAADFNDNQSYDVSYMQDEVWTTIRLTKRLFGKVATVRNIPSNLTCYSRVTGNHPLGKIPKSKCNVIYYEDNDTTLATRCVKCLEGRVNVYGVPHHSPIARRYISHRQCTRTKCEAVCAVVHIPDKLGTGVVENGYWQCGYEIYVSLPRNWTGTCALIQLHGGTIILPHQPREFMRRKKRGLLNIAQDSPVPKNHHIWTIAEKLLAFFVPGIGVASLMEEVQVTRYELISFINTTKIMMEGIKEELRGLRLTALQNRLVLDQLTAERGGVCVIVGETCCRYIPENDNEGHVIEAGIKKLTFMSKTLTDRETTSGFFGLEWFKGIFTNVTNVMLMVICTVCSGLLILCLWPCIRALIRNCLTHQLVSCFCC